MITKTQKLIDALKEGRSIDALRIAKSFRALGPHKAAIQRGWEAYQNPDFYRQINKDPEAAFKDAMAALRTIYGLSLIHI